MKDHFGEFLESIIKENPAIVTPIASGYHFLLESNRISEYEYYKEELKKDSDFNEILNMLKSVNSDKQKIFLIKNLIKRIETIAGSFDRNLIKTLLEFFNVDTSILA